MLKHLDRTAVVHKSIIQNKHPLSYDNCQYTTKERNYARISRRDLEVKDDFC